VPDGARELAIFAGAYLAERAGHDRRDPGVLRRVQAGVTVVNAVLGVAAAMMAFRTLQPISAARTVLLLARGT
jgi:hypothetical protein